MKYAKEKKIERLIRLVWSSLESHLKYTHSNTSEGQKFHIDCIKEYAEQIKLLSELYDTKNTKN